MYFSSLKLFEVLKFFQFLMLFENQFLDTSSNFGAPKKYLSPDTHLWRRIRDLNPGTGFPIYELSKPAPSTAWVILHCLSSLQQIRMKSKHYFISIFVKALLFSNFLDIMPLYGGKINEKIIK